MVTPILVSCEAGAPMRLGSCCCFPGALLALRGAEQKLRTTTLIPMVTLILISEAADATKAPSDTEIAKNHARRTGIAPDDWLSGR